MLLSQTVACGDQNRREWVRRLGARQHAFGSFSHSHQPLNLITEESNKDNSQVLVRDLGCSCVTITLKSRHEKEQKAAMIDYEDHRGSSGVKLCRRLSVAIRPGRKL